ncbi:hypothetical protein CspeluHIS016_0901740 [Cutaneotrichosporon spelunceum]|uniref:FAD dependent oxidoreductase domain-containing protein n=1 Tax=Cutaneotrichosporon spelunceum TaxID=1672016 RepID=A0AAD3U018_9TREE|nr:hypothetical protein CspeluHIS016_0901740 [Cutaneotrichosporon spelunceum]
MSDYDIAIVGAGIVGTALAAQLASHARVLVLDRRGQAGSTALAPGYVGQLNTLAPLTELAQRSVAAYRAISGAFDDVGGLEVATSPAELDAMEVRAALARSRGLPAEVVSGARARELAPAFVEGVEGGLHFPSDGTADARVITAAYRAAALAAGAVFVDADVSAIEEGVEGEGTQRKEGMERTEGTERKEARKVTLATLAGPFSAHTLVLCTGVWSGDFLPLPAVSVAHMYAYSAARPRRPRSPFVRIPSANVYTRDHGDVDGIGSYDHDPVEVSADAMRTHTCAVGGFDAFHDVLARALRVLPAHTRVGFEGGVTSEGGADEGGERAERAFAEMRRAREEGQACAFNGLFKVTPDGMPLAGRVRKGVYCAVGVWVTHAAGTTGVLADMILEDLGMGEAKDLELRKALDPLRFEGKADAVEVALRTYNDIPRTLRNFMQDAAP